MKLRRLAPIVNFKCHAQSQLGRKVKFTLTLPFELDYEDQPTHFHGYSGARVSYYSSLKTFHDFSDLKWPFLGSDRSRSNSPRRKRQRDRSRSSRSRSRSSSGSSGWDHGAGYKGNGGYKGKNWRGGGRGRGRGRKSFRNTESSTSLRGRGYWRPNYIAYGRNIFPGGESSETHSDSSRSFTTSSSSRSSTPEHYKDTPDHSPEPKPRAKTPVKEDGLMDKIQKGIEQKEIERINAIMAQLEQQGKDNAAKINAPRSNHGFVRTMEEKDIFADTDETPQLRKDFKSRADIAKETKGSSPLDPMKKKPKLFDYDDAGLDKGTFL